MSRQNGMTTTRENTLQPMIEMNMTPLIDVLLVLIINLTGQAFSRRRIQ